MTFHCTGWFRVRDPYVMASRQSLYNGLGISSPKIHSMAPTRGPKWSLLMGLKGRPQTAGERKLENFVASSVVTFFSTFMFKNHPNWLKFFTFCEVMLVKRWNHRIERTFKNRSNQTGRLDNPSEQGVFVKLEK